MSDEELSPIQKAYIKLSGETLRHPSLKDATMRLFARIHGIKKKKRGRYNKESTLEIPFQKNDAPGNQKSGS